MSDRVLAIDVGNSRYKVGLFEATDHGLPACLDSIVVPLADAVPWETVAGWTAGTDASAIVGVVAGANPAGVRKVLATWPGDGPPPTVIDDPTRFPLSVDVETPETVGIDRLLNAIAANVLREPDRPAIVVDCGTATTVDAIASDGTFRGGAILPGLELAARSLHQYTALLPYVAVDELGDTPAIGRNTRAALRSGLEHGQVGAVRELIREMSTESNLGGDPLVILTGGGAHLLYPRFPFAHHEPHLTLQGLVLGGTAHPA